MNKLILSILILLTLTLTVNANECFLKTYDQDCKRIATGQNTFQLDDLSTNAEFEKYEIQIFNKLNVENQIDFELEEFNIEQLSPFLEPGVYVIKVKAYLRNNDYIEKEFEYIYDNTDLMPPIIPINLHSSQNTLTFQAKGVPNTQVIAEYDGKEMLASVDSNGQFTISLNSLSQGLNYVKFYSKKGEVKSQIVERLILTENLIPKNSNDVASINIDRLETLNDKTISVNNLLYTGKRNFYVQGKISSFSDKGGQVLFVNGQKTLSDSNGKFGSFVLLNEGENQIIVESGDKKVNTKINYIELDFQFIDFQYSKIIGESKVDISGKTNFDYPFQVYLNGDYFKEFTPKNKEFDFTISNLNEGKNFVELRGLNNEVYNLIVYYDVEMPKAEILSQINLASADKLVFEISDDLGINLNSVSLNIDNKDFTGDYLEIKDNLFSFDISSLKLGEYSFILTGEDLVGKKFEQRGKINLNSDNTLIEDIYFDGSLIGNKMFIKSDSQMLSLIPSRNIAFKSIFLDGVEQTDYEILRSGKVRLNLDITKEKGSIQLNFVNQKYEEFSQTYDYFSDNEKPILILDYIKEPYSNNKVRITGKIEDSNFDWNSLKLNGQNSYLRFGNYFEALIDLENSGKQNLEILGYDYSKNSMDENLGSVLFADETQTSLILDKDIEFVTNLTGSLYESDEGVGNYNFVDSFDGNKFNKLYLSADSFELPLRESYGIRSLNLEGFEGSNNKFNSFSTFKVEQMNDYSNLEFNLEPTIFVHGLDLNTKKTKTTIQGYVTSNKINSASISSGNCQVYDNSFACVVNLNDGENKFSLSVIDGKSKTVSKEIIINKLTSNLNVEIQKIFGSGIFESSGSYYMIDNDVNLEGILSNKANLEILIDGQEFKVGENSGTFNLDLDLTQETDAIESKEINLQLKAKDENGFESFSNTVKVIYKRVFETFASVVVD